MKSALELCTARRGAYLAVLFPPMQTTSILQSLVVLPAQTWTSPDVFLQDDTAILMRPGSCFQTSTIPGTPARPPLQISVVEGPGGLP
jgi:hypothetical protein